MGKSTVLNALLGDKFSEVNMRRTTAGVNYFRIMQSDTLDPKEPDLKKRRTKRDVVISDDTALIRHNGRPKLRWQQSQTTTKYFGPRMKW